MKTLQREYQNKHLLYQFEGDDQEGTKYIQYATQLYMNMLQARVQPQKLDQLKQTFYPVPGLSIRCHNIGNMHRIKIKIGSDYVYTSERTIKKCYCECGITTGWIEESPGSIISTNENNEEIQINDFNWIPEQNTEYKVGACQEVNVDSYEPILIENPKMKPTDFYRHFKSKNQELDTLLLIEDKDITIINQQGESEQKHITLPDIIPCSWDIFRVLSIEVLDEEETEETEIIY